LQQTGLLTPNTDEDLMDQALIHSIFYIFAALGLFCALMVISQNNPVRCVLFLVATFFCSAILWMLTGAEFLSLILVLVYVGAVMTLFLFIVMMLNIDVATQQSNLMRYLPFGLILVALLTGLLMVAAPANTFVETKTPEAKTLQSSSELVPVTNNKPMPAPSNTEALGLVLYTDYFLAFELAAIILLVAIVSAITLTHRVIKRSKRQDIKKQIMTEPVDRLMIVSMPSEKEGN
jgi:NADH-quinone oxidoreductase subunit J